VSRAGRRPPPTRRSSPHGLVVAIADPTTLLGRDVRAVLSERGFPSSKTLLFHTAGEEGLVTGDDDGAAFVAPLAPDGLEGAEVAFLCGNPAGTARFLSARVDDGCLAIDLSGVRSGGVFARPADGPGGSPLPDGNLFLTFDPVALVLAEALAVVESVTPVTAMTAAIDRPASELGSAALDELFRQAIALARFESLPKEILGTQLAFNAHFPDDSWEYEARVAEDVVRLAGRPLPLGLLSARTGVFHGHLLRIELRTAGAAPMEEAIREAFRKTDGFEETDAENLSGPVEAAGRDETLLLQVACSEGAVRVGLAADHLRRAGAIMAVKLAEQAIRERGLLADA